MRMGPGKESLQVRETAFKILNGTPIAWQSQSPFFWRSNRIPTEEVFFKYNTMSGTKRRILTPQRPNIKRTNFYLGVPSEEGGCKIKKSETVRESSDIWTSLCLKARGAW